jgi:hypothetical protein
MQEENKNVENASEGAEESKSTQVSNDLGPTPGEDAEMPEPTDADAEAREKAEAVSKATKQSPDEVLGVDLGNVGAGAEMEQTKEQYLASKGLFETDIQAMAAVVHDIMRVILGRFESFPMAGDFRIVHINEAKVFIDYVTGAVAATDGDAEEFYAGLCDCYAKHGYEMISEYSPINKKTVWGKPFTNLSLHQQLAFRCIYSFLAEYITTRAVQKVSAE